MQILQFYEAILNSLNLVADPHGLISVRNDDDEMRPVMVDNARLTLPLPDILRSGEWGNRVAFHPLSENVARGTSPVIEKIKTAARVRLTYVICGLLINLVEVAADRSRHSKINPKASGFLQALPEADEKSVDAMSRILSAVDTADGYQMVSIYLKRGGTYNGERVGRLARVSFPILKEFERNDGVVFGVKLRKKDQIAFRELFRYILPDADVIETYSGVGSSMIAPFFQALMSAFSKVAKQLNSIVHLQRKQLDDEDFLHTDLKWLDAFEEFEKYNGVIPPLPGNDGAPLAEEAGLSGQQTAPLRFNVPKAPPVNLQPAAVAARVEEAVKDEPVVATSAGYNVDGIIAMREKERQEEAARAAAFASWNAASPTVAPAATPSRGATSSSNGGGLDFNKILASQFQRQQPGTFAQVPPFYQAPMPAQPTSGGYAGRNRGVPAYQAPYGAPVAHYQVPQPGYQVVAAPGYNAGYAGGPGL